jgi:AAA15 family ATPase/GTPase
MFIEFSVKNWRSIKTEQKLSMNAAKGDELAASNTFNPLAPATNNLLRAAAIYGPNAAGKSNIITALKLMRRMVLESASKSQLGDAIAVQAFRLDAETEAQASEFEIVFVADGVRYQYGFAADVTRVTEEWLFAYPLGRPQRWLGRVWDGSAYQWETASALSGQKQLWQESTRENALFLSTAVQLNSKQLMPVFDWFKKNLKIANIAGWHPGFTAGLCKEEQSRSKILAFLKSADLDIHDMQVKTEAISAKHLPENVPAAVMDELLNDLKGKQIVEIVEIKTIHRSAQGKEIAFEMEDESAGTRKFFALAGPWLDALERGLVLVIDELNDRLHPKMVQFLIQLFHSNETNPKNAQLIFTTHETSILNQQVFRRDQIWFCEKNDEQATQLFPLTDFSPRKGREDLEANYLAGRYGALPYLRPLKMPKGDAIGNG